MNKVAIVLSGLGLSALLAGAAQAQSEPRVTGLQLSGDEPIQIESDRLEVRDAEGIAIFTGNVNVVQGPTLLKSGKMTVYYATDGTAEPSAAGPDASRIERLEVDENVYVKTETQVATADKASFDMKTEVLVMTGKEVVLSDDGNVLVGCKLTVQMATGHALLDGCGQSEGAKGRVKMLLQPKSQSQ
ncbi:LPS ABC transporter substrate-binding protein LptA [Nitratireductor sp. CAU 1489]|uniref:LPS ABC transporter substrate-binding protein LptA n=1 Tax=Nitratireductor arenosus TaxID=2682096 RepID=A0A844QFV1_9HYPH|nr:LptA/OstA family protein [Nitratireductor arenosus]MVA96890.1 LPS ABC transporter substrate-binding protein LptA [Nitratireductor arenosus]